MSENFKRKRAIYNGICFRSKLEARWAVVFDMLGIRWIYEPETLRRDFWEFPTYYRPDFYLPEHDKYVEVKPTDEKLFEIQKELSVMVDYGGPLHNGIIILGNIPDSTQITNKLPTFSFLYNNKACCLGQLTFIFDDFWVVEDKIDFTDCIEGNIPSQTSTKCGWVEYDDKVALSAARDAYEAGWFSKDIEEAE